MTTKIPLHRAKALGTLGALIGLSAALGACIPHTSEVMTTTSSIDYRQRHPIAVTEADRSMVVFVGHGRGGLTGPQRTDVTGLANSWRREGTGAVLAEVPVDTPNAHAAAASFREIQSVLVANGVPSRAVTLRHYRPDDPRTLPTIRLSYPKISAVAGPCGLWPQDLAPNIDNVAYSENVQYHNFGCATQRNLAAMIDNPADLEQPRSESPAYSPRRGDMFDKYRKGVPTSTPNSEADKAKLSDTGK